MHDREAGWLQQHEIEAALHDSEQRHEMLFHSAPGPMWVFDVDSLRILAANDAALAQYRYSRDEFLRLTLSDLRPREGRAAFWRAYSAMRAGHEIHGVYQHLRSDGTSLDAEVRTSTIPIGEGRLRLALATDITEHKRGGDAAKFLDRASGILMASLEHDFLCRNLATLAVPALGDWCIFHAGEGALLPCGFAHADPLQQSLVGDLVDERGELPAHHPVLRAWRESAVLELSGSDASAVFDGLHRVRSAELAALLGAQRALYIPVLGRGTTLGVLECVFGRERPAGDSCVRALGVALAERAALAMDNALRFRDLRDAAQALERPATLVHDEGVESTRWLLENMPDCFLRLATDWTITYANAEVERQFGRPRAELLGHNFWTVFPEALGSPFEHAYRRAVEEGRGATVEAYYPGLDAWYQVDARPAADGLALFFRDVTRRRRAQERTEDSEAQYRDFLESATDLVHMLAPDGRVLFANRAWRETLGYAEDELAGLNMLDVVAPESREEASRMLARCIADGETPERELVVLAKDGRRVVVRGRSSCRIIDGRPVSTRAIFRDVTSEVEARTLLARAQRAEAASARARSAFLDSISHEMRTPLTAVIGFADILAANRDGRLSERDLEFARRIGVQGRSLLATVQDVLAYAEIESRRVDLAVTTVELGPLVREVCRLYEIPAARAGVTLAVELPDDDLSADTDAATMRRVLRYLIADALAMAPGGRVAITLCQGSAGPGSLQVAVRAEAVADPRMAPSRDPVAAPSLGIAIAASLAEILGGDVTVERDGERAVTRTLEIGGFPRTRRKGADESAMTLHAMLQASPLPIVAFDADLTVRLWNSAAEEQFGWSAAEAIERKLPLLRPEDDAGFRDLLRTALDSPHGVTDVAAVHRHRDGHDVDVRVALSPLRANDGRLRGFLGIITDVTQRQRLEEQLRRAQKMEVVGRLSGGIAHDFNNLLTVISAHAQFLLRDHGPDEPGHDDARGIVEATERAAVLIRQLLAFSRKVPPHRRLVDVNHHVADTERMLRRIIGSHIEFATAPSAKPLLVHADPSQVEQVLMNLVLNARDAMPRGGALVVEARECEADAADVARGDVPAAGRYAEIVVSDTGVGMDEATRRRIFEPFFTTKSEGRGTGLGLATVHSIVTESGGGIRVESAPGAGSTFTVRLPLSPDAAPEEEMAGEASARRGSETVLLVEDQQAVREVAARVLRSYGYQVVVARHGTDALDILRERGAGIDLLLTDVVMPEMRGDELAAHASLLAPKLRVLFMSGYAELPVDLAQRDVKIPLVKKPFDGEVLARAVRDALDRDETGAGGAS